MPGVARSFDWMCPGGRPFLCHKEQLSEPDPVEAPPHPTGRSRVACGDGFSKEMKWCLRVDRKSEVSRFPASHARKAPGCTEEAYHPLWGCRPCPARKRGDGLPFWEWDFLDEHLPLLPADHAAEKGKGFSGRPVSGGCRFLGIAKDRAPGPHPP